MRDLSYIKHILGVGCSYTKKSSEESNIRIKSPTRTSFIKELAKLQKVPYTNLAIGGHNLFNISLSAYEWIENNPNLFKDTLVIVGLTHFNRQNLWTPDGQPHAVSYHTPREGGSYEYLRDHLYPLDVDLHEYVTFQNVYFKYFTNFNKQQKAELIYIRKLEEYFISNNIPYIFIDVVGENERFSNLPDWHNELKDVYKFPNGEKSWKQYILSYDDNYRLEHPNYEDHVKLGNLLYEYINI